MWAILESRAAHDAKRLLLGRQCLERCDDLIRIQAARKASAQTYLRCRNRNGVLIGEEIHDQWNVSAATGGCGKGATGDGGDQDRRLARH
jgi:hypothetical protein